MKTSNHQTTLEGQAEQVLEIVKERGLLRARDIEGLGFSPTHLQRLYEQGRLTRLGRGIYGPLDMPLDENQSLSEVALRVPHGVVCLVSALQFHHIGTQSPSKVWLALPTRSHLPAIDWPPLRVVQMAASLLEEGVEEHVLNGVTVRMTNPARTVVDCFRFRNKVGIDIALEAAIAGWQERKYTMQEISHYQKICRVTTVMRPYMEAILA
jgi:predicted transcriptional regulator of viral defense system